MRTALKILRHVDGSGNARKIVVAQRGVTAVTRDENLVIAPSLEQGFAVRQVTVAQGAVDADLVRVLLKCQQLLVRQTEAPGFLVIAGAIRGRSEEHTSELQSLRH